MKIIGRTDNGYMIVVKRHELANLCGYYSTSSDDCPTFNSGDEIKVSEMFKQLYDLAYRKEKLAKVASDLREFADLIELHQPIVFNDEKAD